MIVPNLCFPMPGIVRIPCLAAILFAALAVSAPTVQADDDFFIGGVAANVISFQEAPEDDLLTVTLTEAEDADGGPVRYKVTVLPTRGRLFQYDAGASENRGAEITAVDTAWAEVTDAGRRLVYLPVNLSELYEVRFIARAFYIDAGTTVESANREEVILRINADNDAPVFDTAPVLSVFTGVEYDYEITVSDEDVDDPGADLTVTALEAPVWLGLINNGDGTARLTGVPATDDVGAHDVTLRVTDDAGTFDANEDQQFTVFVLQGGSASAATTEDEPAFVELAGAGGATAFTYTITDFPEKGVLYQYNDGDLGDRIFFSTTPVSDDGRRLIYVPSNRKADYADIFYVRIADVTGETVSVLEVTVNVSADNDPPEFTTQPALTASINTAYLYEIAVTDPDFEDSSRSLTLAGDKIPSWLTFTDNGDGTAELKGAPALSDAGEHEIAFTLTDADGVSVLQNFVVTVLPPEVTEFDAAKENNRITADTTWSEQVTIKAGEENTARFITVPAGVTLTISPGATIEFNDGLGLLISGGLVAEGTPEQKIVFTGEAWGGLSFSNADQPSRLVYCDVGGVSGAFAGGVSVKGGTAEMRISRSTISGNAGLYGGGVYLSNSDAVIEYNDITGAKNVQRGGGVYCGGGGPVIRYNNIFANTDAGSGGGLFLTGNTAATIYGNLIQQNTARQGGGIYMESVALEYFENNVIVSNTGTKTGGGLYLAGASPTITNATIARNLSPVGPGVYGANASPRFENTILFGNNRADDRGADSGEADPIALEGGAPTFAYSVLEADPDAGALDDTNLVDQDPAFAGPARKAGAEDSGNDWSLTAPSHAINGGSPGFSPSVAVDAAEAARIFNGFRVDIGAYEFPNNPPVFATTQGNLPGIGENDGELRFSLTDLSTADDPDAGDTLGYRIVAPPESGTLFQVSGGRKGDEVVLLDETVPLAVADTEGLALIYAPANRSADYTDRFTYDAIDMVTAREGIPPSSDDEQALSMLNAASRETVTVSISVTASNDAPEITSFVGDLSAPVGFAYTYELTAVDPDLDHETGSLALSAPSIQLGPAWSGWLAFTDNADGTGMLTGTPASGDVGEHEVTLRATDPAGDFTEQSFRLLVTMQATLSVEAGEDISGAPGEPVFLTATSDAATPVFSWTIARPDGNPVKTGTGQNFSWTPAQAERTGSFIAEVVVNDGQGGIPGTDSLGITIAEGFSAVNDDDRPLPDEAQSAQIEALGALNPDDPNFIPSATAGTISELSKLKLTSAQRDRMLDGMEAVAQTGLADETVVNLLLGAMDNLTVEALKYYRAANGESRRGLRKLNFRTPFRAKRAGPDNIPDNIIDLSDLLSGDQVSRMLGLLEQISVLETLSAVQVAKALETINEMAAQQSVSALTLDQKGMVGDIGRALFDASLERNERFVANSRTFLQITVVPNPVDGATVGGNAVDDPQYLLSANTVAEISATTGNGVRKFNFRNGVRKFNFRNGTFSAGLLANAVTDGRGYILSAELRGSDEGELPVSGLANPVRITIPLADTAKRTPMFFNETTGFWDATGISNIDAANETHVAFDADHLTDFALFQEQSSPVTGEERDDVEKFTDAVEDASSGGGCVAASILPEF